MLGLETWTDDHGVTHAATSLQTACMQVVASRVGPASHDVPARTVTCIYCAQGVASPASMESAIEALRKHGYKINKEALDQYIKERDFNLKPTKKRRFR